MLRSTRVRDICVHRPSFDKVGGTAVHSRAGKTDTGIVRRQVWGFIALLPLPVYSVA